MNYSTAVFLINDDVRAILASYEYVDYDINRMIDKQPAKQIRMFKTLDPSIKKGDFVVIPTGTRHKMTVVKVEEVDVHVDFNSSEEVPWIIAKVDRTAHEDLLEQEKEAVEMIKAADMKKKRKELRSAMLGDAADEVQPLTLIGSSTDTTPPPSPSSVEKVENNFDDPYQF